MTEKRFVNIGVEWVDGFIQDHEDDKDLFSTNAVCDLLNELSEENEQLKKTNQRLNDELQNVTSLESLKIGENTTLQRENKRLKSILRIYRKVANCQNCDYHDYDCYSDGDDFEVCEKGHDMSYSICKDWRKL